MADGPDKRDTGPGDGSVAEAMNRVLAAEREALEEIQGCREHAGKTLESARREARAIQDHAERIARDIHARTGPLAETRARQLREQWAQRQRAGEPEGALAAAVTRLATRMTGGHA